MASPATRTAAMRRRSSWASMATSSGVPSLLAPARASCPARVPADTLLPLQ